MIRSVPYRCWPVEKSNIFWSYNNSILLPYSADCLNMVPSPVRTKSLLHRTAVKRVPSKWVSIPTDLKLYRCCRLWYVVLDPCYMPIHLSLPLRCPLIHWLRCLSVLNFMTAAIFFTLPEQTQSPPHKNRLTISRSSHNHGVFRHQFWSTLCVLGSLQNLEN